MFLWASIQRLTKASFPNALFLALTNSEEADFSYVLTDLEMDTTSGQKENKKSIFATEGLARELMALFLKFSVCAVLLLILFGYVFGLTRNLSLNMQPAFQDGDLVLYYRIVQKYPAGEVVVIHYEDRTLMARVAAVAGDTVDITDDGLMINGSVVQETGIIGETTLFKEGVTFPLTVPDGRVFVLGDNREQATDSRIFGCIDIKAIDGRVIGLFRRRNF